MQSARHTLLLLIGLLWLEAVYSAAAEATNETAHLLHGEVGPIQQQAPAQGLLQQLAGQQETAAGQPADQRPGAAAAASSQEVGEATAKASRAAVSPKHAAKGGSAVRRWIQRKLDDLQQTLESVPGLAPEPAVAFRPQESAAVVSATAAVTSHQGPASSDAQGVDTHAKQHQQQQQHQQHQQQAAQQVTQQNFQQALATAVQQAEQAAEPQALAAFNVRCMHPCTLLWLAPASCRTAGCTQPWRASSDMLRDPLDV